MDRLAETLRRCRRGILALPAGGCTRYIFSTEVAYEVDDTGCPIFDYESENPFHHQLLAQSGMSLRIPVEFNPDGSERAHLLLLGNMETIAGNEAAVRRYRLKTTRAQVIWESGEVRTLPSVPGRDSSEGQRTKTT